MSYEKWLQDDGSVIMSMDGMGSINHGSDKSGIVDWVSDSHPDYDPDGTHYSWDRLAQKAPGAWVLKPSSGHCD